MSTELVSIAVASVAGIVTFLVIRILNSLWPTSGNPASALAAGVVMAAIFGLFSYFRLRNKE